MILRIARFELTKRRGMLSSYVYFVVALAFGFLAMAAAAGAFSGVSVSTSSDKVHPNGPHSLQGLIEILSHFCLFISAAVFGQAVHQDFEARIDQLVFSTPISRLHYLVGRFLGAFAFSLVVFVAIGLGAWLATLMPFVDRALLGPNRFAYYAWPYLTAVIPNLFITGTLFFGLGALLRRMMPVYVATVVLVVGYLVAVSMLHKLESKSLASMIDPFGFLARGRVTEYFTIAEKNSLLVPFRGLLLANRALWVSLAAVFFGFVLRRFRFAHTAVADRQRAADDVLPPTTIPRIVPAGGAPLALFLRTSRLAFVETVKNVYFGVIALCGVLFMIGTSWQAGDIYGTATYPVTCEILELTGGTFSIFVLIIITFYAGELVWRERDARMDQILDALPTPTWLGYTSKLAALALLIALLLGVVMVTGMGLQLARGYTTLEPQQYVRTLFGISFVDYLILAVLALWVQALVQNKYVGHFVMVLYYVSLLFFSRLGIEHNLVRFGGTPSWQYSDMNRYGHLVRPVTWFQLYWSLVGGILVVGSLLLWPRGMERRGRARLAEARRRTTFAAIAATVLLGLGAASAGGYIFYNTNVLNRYRTQHDDEKSTAEYEKTYKATEKLPQPTITDVRVSYDVHPERQQLTARGRFLLHNKSTSAIPTVWINLPEDAKVDKLALGTAPAPAHDAEHGVYVFTMSPPLAPDAEVALEFSIDYGRRGFRNGSQETEIVDNGTFFSSGNLPFVGYERNAELQQENDRKKYGLAPRARKADVNDLAALMHNELGADADWIHFAADVTTSEDQLAFVPGYLVRESTENGRRRFEYAMDAPILNFYTMVSGRYAVKKDRWNDVALEIDYHPSHTYDLDRMMAGAKAALDYASSQFGPYQHRQVRIVEFPRYQAFAQSFPNTIPFSEAIGFIAKVDPNDPDDVDYPFYVTAHEVAHQWWGHQVVGGDVQGASMLAETMAQYTALMVMKHELGEKKMRRFLKHELDGYLRGRGAELEKEMPLARVEDQQYLHYQKGSVVMYALQDYLGEDVLNRVLAAYVKKVKFQAPPYTNTTELLAMIRDAAPDEMKPVVDDLFERITLYDNRVTSAKATKLPDGRWRTVIAYSAKKLNADGLGEEKDAPMNDLIDVGALDEHDDVLLAERRRIAGGEGTLEIVTDQRPTKAGLDPLGKLIDRKADDNCVSVAGE